MSRNFITYIYIYSFYTLFSIDNFIIYYQSWIVKQKMKEPGKP